MARSTSSRQVLKGKFLRLVTDAGWEFVERSNASGVVAIIAVTTDRELVLTEQYRIPVKCRVIDLPAGLSGDIAGQEAEAQIEAARRELFEETGYESKVWKSVYTAPSSPGLTSEIVHYFQTSNARQRGQGGGVEGESIVTHAIPLSKLRRWLRARMGEGFLVDPKVYVALALLR